MKIRKVLKHLPLFIVATDERAVPESMRDRMNIIISYDIDELKEKLSANKERSRRFTYWLVGSAKELSEWMRFNKMQYAVYDNRHR